MDKYSGVEGSQAILNTERKERLLQPSIRDKSSLNKKLWDILQRRHLTPITFLKAFLTYIPQSNIKLLKLVTYRLHLTQNNKLGKDRYKKNHTEVVSFELKT